MYSDAEMETVRRELGVVTVERDSIRANFKLTQERLETVTADLEATRRALGIAEAERDTAMDALTSARKDAAHWRGEAECWQARYEGMEAALRVALEVRK